MKKALIIILTIVLLCTTVLFVYCYHNIQRRKVGIATEYFDIVVLNKEITSFSSSSIRGEFTYNLATYSYYGNIFPLDFQAGHVYDINLRLKHMPVDIEGSYIGDLKNQSNYIDVVGFFNCTGLNDEGNYVLEFDSYEIVYNSKYFTQVIDSNLSAFNEGLQEFSIFDSTQDNLLTWLLDLVKESLNTIRGFIADFGGVFTV